MPGAKEYTELDFIKLKLGRINYHLSMYQLSPEEETELENEWKELTKRAFELAHGPRINRIPHKNRYIGSH